MSESLSLSQSQGIFLTGLKTKFRAYVGGFGSGKTFVGCLDLLLFAGQHPGTTQGYFAPTYRDIKDTFWPTLDEAAEMLGFRIVVQKSDKEVTVYRGSAYYGTIICRSMDEPGGIVGFKIARALVDEIDILPTDKATAAWRKIIARMRLVIPGVVNGIGVTTTPEGFKFVYQTFGNPNADYSMVQASTYENQLFLPPDYITSLRDSYPQELIDAYLLGNFVNLTSGTVYRNYNRSTCRSRERIKPKEALHIGQDFNVNKMFSVVYVERSNGFHAVDQLKNIVDTPALCETLLERYRGHEVIVYPDASGTSRKTVDASKSDIKLLQAAGFRVRAKKANPPVKDRILAMNTGFSKARLWVNDERCPDVAQSLEQQAYDKNGEPDKTGDVDHPNDAAGYPIHWLMPVRKPKRAEAASMKPDKPTDYRTREEPAGNDWML